jgi:hypothetical protein
MAPIGSLAVGYLGEHAGPRVAVLMCGIITLMCAFYLLTRLSVLSSAEMSSERSADGACT